ncbi:DNA ligase D [Nevskia ramosa]|uniref:DNA ligase D n=1 Tax=Nevskia ramosa TaxID=64002 RepID=UPI003D0A4B6F
MARDSTARNATSEAALKRYRAKRDFAITSEPASGGDASTGALSFVIQKHWASSLHYDFRLELDGTMKSWAVPKGPSFDPAVKRMAIEVEDHPISYSSFEGTIPAKQYGAGKVIVWDAGSWHPVSDPRKAFRAGNLKFTLTGQKLHGRWVLVRIKGKSEKQTPWLLIKEKDEFVRSSADYSVVDELPDSVKPAGSAPRVAAKSKRAKPLGDWPAGTVKARLPAKLSPQLATLVDKPPPAADGWIFEIKFDGYRLLTRIDHKEIRLYTRNGNDWTSKLLPVQAAIAKLKLPPGWYDGEIVVPNDQGVPDFGALQQALESETPEGLILYLFDLPFLDGHDLRKTRLDARRALLQSLLTDAKGTTRSEQMRFSGAFDGDPESVKVSACRLGLEGIIAKRGDSNYVSRRSPDWIKLKCGQRQEFVIVGYTDPQGSRSGFGALLLAVHDEKGALRYAGKVGSGFDRRRLLGLTSQLEKLTIKQCPLARTPKVDGKPHWVTPKLIAEVSFAQWTAQGQLRHAVFRGLRADKPAAAIVREKSIDMKGTAPASRLKVTHPERVIDTQTGTTKLDLVRYYGLVGDLMIDHLKGRPVALLRAPDGVAGQQFFQKHAGTEKLPGVRKLDTRLDPEHPPMLEVTNKAGLLSAAQWNVVEFHTLNTSNRSVARADRMIFDLDPGAGIAWPQVQEAAELMHAFLKQLGLPGFLKTSGGKGLHVVVPLLRRHDRDTVKGFAQTVVQHLAKALPQRFVAKSGPKNRIGKIYIDYLRNGPGASTVSAWSARARSGLGISVPVNWQELASLRGGDHWTVASVHTRLDRGNDPWKDYADSACSLTAAMKLLDYKA